MSARRDDAPRHARPSVLVVEDDPNVRLMIVAQLERRLPDVDVIGAADAKEGLAVLDRAHVDLILSDFHLPDMNGLEFLTRARREHPATRRVMLTGAPEEGLALDASREAGIERFFVKPLDMTAFSGVVKKILRPPP